MQINLKLLKKLVKESLEEDEQKKISDSIIKYVDDGLDTDEAVNKYIKDNPEVSDVVVAKALKAHPVNNSVDAAFIKENRTMKMKASDFARIIEEECMGYLESLLPHGGSTELTELDEADPRVIAMQQASDLLDDLQFDSLESAIDNMNTEVLRKLSIMIKELDYKRNQVGNLEEGDDHSRTITQIEKIGDEVLRLAQMSIDPAVIERIEMIDDMITDVLAQMQGVKPAGFDADGYSKMSGQRPMEEKTTGKNWSK